MFSREQLEAIYVLFDRTNVNGIESKEMQVSVMKEAHAQIQAMSRPVPDKKEKPDA